MYTYEMKKKISDVQNEQGMMTRTADVSPHGVPNSVMLDAARSDSQEQVFSTGGTDLEQAMRIRMDSRFDAVSGVQVHYNSDLPERVDAEAYTRGDHIYLGPGQERHLPHELGHVVQQRRGSVTANERIGGMAANTDIQLEHEADVIGRQFEGMLSVSNGGLFGSESVSESSAHGSTAPVQMAGHDGVIVYGGNDERGIKTLYKCIEQNEYNAYLEIKRLQNERVNDNFTEQAIRAQNVFPIIYDVGIISDPNVNNVPEGYNPNEWATWLENAHNLGYYVKMANLGGDGGTIKDFKLGTQTAHAKELKQNHHFSDPDAEAKEDRMKGIDQLYGSAAYGIRDSDVAGRALTWLKFKISNLFSCCGDGAEADTLDEMRGLVRNSPNSYNNDCQVIKDLEAIKQYISDSDTIYIASSVIIKMTGDPNQDMARLIDLAHPVTQDAIGEDFERIKTGMLLGIQNLEKLFTSPGAPLITLSN